MLIEPILLYGSEAWTLTTRPPRVYLMGHILIYSDVLKTFTGLSTPHVSAFTAIFHHSTRSSPSGDFNSPVIARELWVRSSSPSYCTVEAKWPCQLQKIGLCRRESQGLGDRQVRSWERYGGP